jgi:tetratricopeptide (TPR) repeat protein
MRGIVKEVAEENREPWIDFIDILERQTLARSGHDILGEPDFVDHVHLTIEDYRLLAQSVIDKMIQIGAVRPDPGWDAASVDRVTKKVMGKVDDQMQGLGLHNIAKTLNWAGKHEDAARIAERALEKDTTSLEAIWSSLYVGAARERQGKEDEAIPQYRRAVRLDPNNPLSHGYLAGALMRAGLAREAIAEYLECLKLDPEDARAAQNIGMLYMQLGQLQNAVLHLRRAVTVMPGRPDLSTMLGMAYYQSGLSEDAAASFRRALDLDPRQAWAWVGLGHIADDRNDRRSAIDFFSKALSITPDLVEARQALSRDLNTMPGNP